MNYYAKTITCRTLINCLIFDPYPFLTRLLLVIQQGHSQGLHHSLSIAAEYLHLLCCLDQWVILLLMSQHLKQVLLEIRNYSVVIYNLLKWLSTVPNPPVINAIINISVSTVRVIWSRPTMPNGIISSYTIRYIVDSNIESMDVDYNGLEVSVFHTLIHTYVHSYIFVTDTVLWNLWAVTLPASHSNSFCY